MREPESKFLRVKCKKCRNEQTVFNKAASKVVCLVCGNELSDPTGGKSIIKTTISRVLE